MGLQPEKKKRRFSLKASLRKAFFFLHLWLGLFVGVYFSVVGITGSILVFEEDLEVHLLMPERSFVAPPTPDAKFLPLSEMVTRLRAQFPEATDAELGFITPPPQSGGRIAGVLPPTKKPS
jgi:uncharacterized iron-regulated membrane protein